MLSRPGEIEVFAIRLGFGEREIDENAIRLVVWELDLHVVRSHLVKLMKIPFPLSGSYVSMWFTKVKFFGAP